MTLNKAGPHAEVQHCDEFDKDPTHNPVTGRRIKKNGRIHSQWKETCSKIKKKKPPTRQKLCLQCSTSNIFASINKGLANWIAKQGVARTDAVPPKAPNPSTRMHHPDGATVQISIKVGGKNGKVLFWAAQPRRVGDAVIVDAPSAYGSYSNMGISQVKDGKLKVKVKCPRPYREEGRVYPPHVHFAYRNGDTWSTNIHTIAAFPGHYETHSYSMTCMDHSSSHCCVLTPLQLKKKWNKFIVVNALPKTAGDGILPSRENSWHIPYNQKTIVEECALIGDHPYVVYCMHPRCSAASQLILRLIKGGCMNVYYMPAGIKGWTSLQA